MNFFALSVVVLLLISAPIAQAVKTKNLWLDHQSLHEQPIFWAAIAWPLAIALILGFPIWTSYSFQLDAKGYSSFLEITKLPIGILGAGLAITAFITSIHRSIQTATQIEYSTSKQQDEIDERTLATAQECLERAYELLNKSGEIKEDHSSWANSAAFIVEFTSKKRKIKNPSIFAQLKTREDYWRAKLEELTSPSGDSIIPSQIKADPAILVVVMEFSKWRKDRELAAQPGKSGDLFEDIISGFQNGEQNNYARRFQYYLIQNKDKVRQHQVFLTFSEQVNMPHPEQVLEDAIQRGDSDDPLVIKERNRRNTN